MELSGICRRRGLYQELRIPVNAKTPSGLKIRFPRSQAGWTLQARGDIARVAGAGLNYWGHPQGVLGDKIG